jgi:hypothetical protein
MKCTGTVASCTNSGHSHYILFMCISIVAIIIITRITLGGFYIVRVYVNVRTYDHVINDEHNRITIIVLAKHEIAP